MAMSYETGTPVNLTANGTASLASCNLLGFYVNSTTGGTIVLRNGTTAISGTITPAIGWHAFPAACPSGVTVVIANTLDVTLFVAAG